MRVGIVTQAYYPLASGVTEHVYNLARHLQAQGHEPTIITSKFLRINPYNHDEGLKVIRLGLNVPVPVPLNGSFNCINLGFQTGAILEAICQKNKFDIVHIQSPLDPILPLIAMSHIKTPLVGTFHSYSSSALLYDFFRREFETRIKNLRGRIAVSQAAKEYVANYFEGDYRIIPNGIDTQRFNPSAKPIAKFDDDFFNILFVGRMNPRKGLKNLLRALPTVFAKHPKTRLIVVGSGLLSNYYKLYYPNSLADRVHFVGYVPRGELASYYRTADVYCSPATGGESFGIVLLEAMATGAPIVASAIRGYSEVVTDGQEGLLVPPEDPMLISRAIIRLIENEGLRKKMSEVGHKKAQEYSWANVAKQVAEYYQEICRAKPI